MDIDSLPDALIQTSKNKKNWKDRINGYSNTVYKAVVGILILLFVQSMWQTKGTVIRIEEKLDGALKLEIEKHKTINRDLDNIKSNRFTDVDGIAFKSELSIRILEYKQDIEEWVDTRYVRKEEEHNK